MKNLPVLLTRMAAAERRIRDLENKIHALNRTVHLREDELAALRKENSCLIRNSYRYLGNLYYIYLITGSPAAVTHRLQEIWKDACGQPGNLNRLAGFLDGHSEHIVRDLRSSVPGLGVEETDMFCCFAVGMDAPLVAELTGVSVNAVYTRKNRMIGKIRKLGPKKAHRFLDRLA